VILPTTSTGAVPTAARDTEFEAIPPLAMCAMIALYRQKCMPMRVLACFRESSSTTEPEGKLTDSLPITSVLNHSQLSFPRSHTAHAPARSV
jgi:hypothetical protein